MTLNPYALREWPLDKRVRYVNALRKVVSRRCPKNKLGVPLVSDFDLLTADLGECREALGAIEFPLSHPDPVSAGEDGGNGGPLGCGLVVT